MSAPAFAARMSANAGQYLPLLGPAGVTAVEGGERAMSPGRRLSLRSRRPPVEHGPLRLPAGAPSDRA